MKNFFKVLAIAALVLYGYLTHAQNTVLTQTIKGVVVDADSKKTLANVSVSLLGSRSGATTDSIGQFKISGVPIGRHSIDVSLIGYESRQVAEIAVTSGKEIYLTI